MRQAYRLASKPKYIHPVSKRKAWMLTPPTPHNSGVQQDASGLQDADESSTWSGQHHGKHGTQRHH